MASKVVPNEDLIIIHSVTFDWDISKWNETPMKEFMFREFWFFPDFKIKLELRRKIMNFNLHVSIDGVACESLHSSICFINRNGQECFKTNPDFLEIRKSNSYNWSLHDVKTVVHEKKFTVRCNFSVENIHVPDMFAKMKISTQREIPTLKGKSENAVEQATQTEECYSSSKSENAVEPATQTEECYSKTTPINYLEKLSSDFETIYGDQADTDCIVKAGDGQYSAHRAILSARSKVFAAMFHHDTAERRTGEVNIKDVEAIILSDLIHYIYTGKVKGLTSDKVIRLYAAADKYALNELRDACSDFLACHLTIENVCDAAILARSHAEDALEKEVLYFIVNRFDEVTESEEWKDFFNANPIIASKYLTAAFKIK